MSLTCTEVASLTGWSRPPSSSAPRAVTSLSHVSSALAVGVPGIRQSFSGPNTDSSTQWISMYFITASGCWDLVIATTNDGERDGQADSAVVEQVGGTAAQQLRREVLAQPVRVGRGRAAVRAQRPSAIGAQHGRAHQQPPVTCRVPADRCAAA